MSAQHPGLIFCSQHADLCTIETSFAAQNSAPAREVSLSLHGEEQEPIPPPILQHCPRFGLPRGMNKTTNEWGPCAEHRIAEQETRFCEWWRFQV